MKNRIDRFIKIYPWYSGFTGDLLFYIAIDTLFLTIVKDFSAAQIVSITSFSHAACIVLQFPILFLIRRIGNTASVRTGALLLLLSAVMITVSKRYYLVLIGRLFHDVAAIFRSASFVMLENNLDLVDKRRDFVRIRTAANTVYSVATMLISFVASYMFNLQHYLPMVGCIITCLIGFVLSFFMKDHSDYNRISHQKSRRERVKLPYSRFVAAAVVVYALFYSLVSIGQSEGKLFIQQQTMLGFNVDNTALIIGAIVCVSRIIRVFSNVIFARLYEKHQAKMGVALSVLLGSALAFILFGSFIPPMYIKIPTMAIGYVIILFVRDPFRLYMQDVIFDNTPKEQHQTLLATLEFGIKVGTAALGLSFSAVLLHFPMAVVMAAMLVLAVIEIVLSVKFYQTLLGRRAPAKAQSQ